MVSTPCGRSGGVSATPSRVDPSGNRDAGREQEQHDDELAGSLGRAAAQAWVNAAFHHDADKARSLECDEAEQEIASKLPTVGLTAGPISGFRATDTQPTQPGQWQVTLQTQPGAQSTFSVTVEKHGSAYLVCG